METGGRGAPVELELLVQPIVLRRAGKHQKYHGVVLLYIESFSENIGKLEETLESWKLCNYAAAFHKITQQGSRDACNFTFFSGASGLGTSTSKTRSKPKPRSEISRGSLLIDFGYFWC